MKQWIEKPSRSWRAITIVTTTIIENNHRKVTKSDCWRCKMRASQTESKLRKTNKIANNRFSLIELHTFRMVFWLRVFFSSVINGFHEIGIKRQIKVSKTVSVLLLIWFIWFRHWLLSNLLLFIFFFCVLDCWILLGSILSKIWINS